mgnify:FL=1|jgi:hypothetical protein
MPTRSRCARSHAAAEAQLQATQEALASATAELGRAQKGPASEDMKGPASEDMEFDDSLFLALAEEGKEHPECAEKEHVLEIAMRNAHDFVFSLGGGGRA